MMGATLDLEGAGHWTRTDGLVPRELVPADRSAVCDGDTFYYFCESRSLLICGAEGVFLTTHNGELPYVQMFEMDLVAHRGSVFFMAELDEWGMSCGIWRFVRSRMAWEAVAGLKKEKLNRLIKPKYADAFRHEFHCAWGAGDHLCVKFASTRTIGRMSCGSWWGSVSRRGRGNSSTMTTGGVFWKVHVC